MRALIADDDPVGAMILAAALGRLGLSVVTAKDGEDAWRILQADSGIALVLLDWMMPGIDGPELCRRIRSSERHAHVHIIFVTARDGSGDAVTGLEAGADDYLIKPFDPQELRARVQVAIRVATLQERLTARIAELEEALSRVKQLSGMLPICSYCKRIRSDENYWQQVDTYITEHSDAEFSHGICPHCFEIVRAEFEE